MKKIVLVIAAVLLMSSITYCDEADSSSWTDSPIITKAYEISSGEMFLAWEGNAPLYRVSMDGEKVKDVAVSDATFKVSKGTHSIVVYPVNKTDKGDTSVNLDFGLPDIGNFGVGLDLAALGINAKDLATGKPSETLNIDFLSDPIISAKIDAPVAVTDDEDRVCLSFGDYYSSDECQITIKRGKSVNYVSYNMKDNELVTRDSSDVSVILDPDYLQEQNCIVPKLEEDYKISVQLRKYANDYLSHEPLPSVIHESAISDELKYTPTALWKNAPTITYASQTADGQITLQWEHEDYNRGCEYSILSVKKTLGVTTKEKQIGTTANKEYTLSDLANGDYSYKILPLLDEEKGSPSESVDVEVKNDWVIAPAVEYEITEKGDVKLSWPVSDGIDKYHVTAFKGDKKSPLRYVNLDYKKYSESDIEELKSTAEYLFSCSDGETLEPGDRLRFEIYGVHLAADGTEQKTSTTTRSITVE